MSSLKYSPNWSRSGADTQGFPPRERGDRRQTRSKQRLIGDFRFSRGLCTRDPLVRSGRHFIHSLLERDAVALLRHGGEEEEMLPGEPVELAGHAEAGRLEL